MRKILFFFQILLLPLNAIAQDFGDIPFYQELKSKDASVLAINVEGIEIDGSILAYNMENKIFIPIVSFANLLNFPTKISDDGLSANGWFIDEKNKFRIDLNKKIITSKNAKISLNADNVKKFDGDIFVELEVIEKIFDFSLLMINLSQFKESLLIWLIKKELLLQQLILAQMDYFISKKFL